PLAPLDQDLIVARWAEGFTRTMEEMDAIISVRLRFVNYYPYMSMPLNDFGDETQEEALARGLATAEKFLPGLQQRWTDEYLPEMLPALKRATTTDFASL